MNKDSGTKQKYRTSQKIKNRKEKEKWEKPTLEDVSGKVMAQPYIRFT